MSFSESGEEGKAGSSGDCGFLGVSVPHGAGQDTQSSYFLYTSSHRCYNRENVT